MHAKEVRILATRLMAQILPLPWVVFIKNAFSITLFSSPAKS